jgi:hypothetical protein
MGQRTKASQWSYCGYDGYQCVTASIGKKEGFGVFLTGKEVVAVWVEGSAARAQLAMEVRRESWWKVQISSEQDLEQVVVESVVFNATRKTMKR